MDGVRKRGCRKGEKEKTRSTLKQAKLKTLRQKLRDLRPRHRGRARKTNMPDSGEREREHRVIN